MFEDFVEADLGLVKVNNFTGKLYKKDINFNNSIKEISIYTGVWTTQTWSLPDICSSINDYTHLGLALIGYSGKLLPFKDLKVLIILKNELSKHFEMVDYCSFVKVPKNIICNLFIDLGISSKEIESKNLFVKDPIKTGGICKRCKSFDEYAEIKPDGTCLCYKCFY